VALRHVLSLYTGIRPEDLLFSRLPGGKPRLVARHGNPAPEFSVTRSKNRALIAISIHCPVGVDLEFVRPVPALASLTERFFAPGERAALQRLPRNRWITAFFTLWTRKEAVLKAAGLGLADGLLDGFEIPLVPAETGLAVSPLPGSVRSEWTLFDLSAGPEFKAALAAGEPKASPRLLDWPDAVREWGKKHRELNRDGSV
jgi:4'-phosphopantetheinyl transferase